PRVLPPFPTRRSSDLKASFGLLSRVGRALRTTGERAATAFHCRPRGAPPDILLTLLELQLLQDSRADPAERAPGRHRRHSGFAQDRKSTRLNSSHDQI